MTQAGDTTKRKVLIFGGTFDPPHLAHAQLPMLAAAQLGCDEILYVPAAINPLKSGAKLKPAPPEHRLAMLLLAVADVPGAKISTLELDRKGKSYTIDTLWALHKEYGAPARRSRSPQASSRKPQATSQAASLKPRVAFHLLIGADQALDFHRWKSWEQILELATPAVMLRPPWSRRIFAKDLKSRYSSAESAQWLDRTLNLPMIDISATTIRARLHDGESTDDLLDPAVAAYIKANGLYR